MAKATDETPPPPPPSGKGSVGTRKNPERGFVNLTQYETLRKPLRGSRVLTREGKYSYLAAWDVRAHLIRLFGFGSFDAEIVSDQFMGIFDYESSGSNPKPMVEVTWKASVRLVVRDEEGFEIARYTEGAVGSATGGRNAANRGDLMDNALKTAASDAFKRCCINLGTQFGLSLYDSGNLADVVRVVLVGPEGFDAPTQETDEDRQAREQLNESLGGAVTTDPDARHQEQQTAEETAGMPSQTGDYS